MSATHGKGTPMSHTHAVDVQQVTTVTGVKYNQVPRRNSVSGSVCEADEAISDRCSATLKEGAKSRAFDMVLSTRNMNVHGGEKKGDETQGGGGGGVGVVGREAAVWRSQAFAGDWLDSEC